MSYIGSINWSDCRLARYSTQKAHRLSAGKSARAEIWYEICRLIFNWEQIWLGAGLENKFILPLIDDIELISVCLDKFIFTFELILNIHTASFDFVKSILLFNLFLSSSLPSTWSLVWAELSLSEEWPCFDINGWRKLDRLQRKKTVVREIKWGLPEPWPSKRGLRIGIQLQISPAHISAVLQRLELVGLGEKRSKLTLKCKLEE